MKLGVPVNNANVSIFYSRHWLKCKNTGSLVFGSKFLLEQYYFFRFKERRIHKEAKEVLDFLEGRKNFWSQMNM